MKKFLKEHYLFISILIGALLLRFLLAVYLSSPQFTTHDDLLRYQDWGRIGYHHGIKETYNTTHLTFGIHPNNQPPATAYMDMAVYALYHTTGSSSKELYGFLLKFPSIVADCIIGVLIYYVVRRKTKKNMAVIASSLFLYNPVVVYNSTVWGQIDAVNNMFFYLSVLFVFARKYFLSVFMLGMSLFIKLSLLPLAPFLLFFLLKKMNFNFLKLFIYLVITTGVFLLFTLPVSSNPIQWLTQFFLTNASGELQYITNYTFNFWSVLFNPDSFSLIPESSQVYFGLPLSVWGYLIFGAFVLPLGVLCIKNKKIDETFVMSVLFIVAYAAFLFLPRMHQRYLYPVLPFIATYIGLTGRSYIPYILLSMINFINLYVVFHPTDFLPVFFTNIIAHSKIRLSMSILIVLVFLFLYGKVTIKRIAKLRHF